MAKWSKFPHAEKAYQLSADTLKKQWAALHIGDAEPLPKDAAVLDAWRAFHAGDFEAARDAGLAAGGAGITVANLATNIYANYIEKKEAAQIKLFQEVMARAEQQQASDPTNPGGFYAYAYAAGRYSQNISIVKALAEGYGGKIKSAIEKALKLQPKHAHAHLAMGTYHAEVVDKIGGIAAKLTYGASKDNAEKHFKEAMKLAPNLPIAQIEYANALMLMQGDKGEAKATELYVAASEFEARDAMERLDVELAKASLEE